jgi:SAM-dependent methyltransferase
VSATPPTPGRFTYDEIAEAYAAGVDTAPYNALYERPATLALLPPVAGRRVLDAGCGSGWYAEQLLARGARVTAVDGSAAMAAYARARLGDRADVHVADLAQPLPFRDGRFDVVLSALVLHYLRDWATPLAELHRVLAPDGTLVFSTHHPTTEADRLEAAGQAVDYAAVEPVEEDWTGVGRVHFYRRPLAAVIDALADAGFLVERFTEPRPTPAFAAARPDAYARLLRRPAFVVVRARTGGHEPAA